MTIKNDVDYYSVLFSIKFVFCSSMYLKGNYPGKSIFQFTYSRNFSHFAIAYHVRHGVCFALQQHPNFYYILLSSLITTMTKVQIFTSVQSRKFYLNKQYKTSNTATFYFLEMEKNFWKVFPKFFRSKRLETRSHQLPCFSFFLNDLNVSILFQWFFLAVRAL